ncbi:MAG TPA: tRNA (N6-threonylcarbamoyladenosine(37)-N6)-methyltransferase TrmO [Firmicutes bacterium]|nr:tRNA (N6-threonylcarbamoyladenosine(37)-N6)-methyltransferase TrmO [Bacillota bacterium]
MGEIVYEPIGIIHTPFTSPEGVPIQPSGGRDVEGFAELDPRYEEGLADLEGFSHAYLIYHLHLADGYRLKVVPFMDSVERGVFATRAPRRPNPIGISLVRIKAIEGNRLYFVGVDVVDGTPLLDIKPFVPQFEAQEDIRIGWLEDKVHRAGDFKADGRFQK